MICKDKQSIGSSRSFGQAVMSLETLSSALASYVMLAAKKLRKQKQYAQALQVYLSTNRYRVNALHYQNSLTLPLPVPSNDTSHLIAVAKKGLKLIYRKGFQYQKVGILLIDLTQQIQTDLFNNNNNKSEKLMSVIDNINQQMGCNSLFFAAQGIKQHWKTKRDYQSPHYTTQWEQIPGVV